MTILTRGNAMDPFGPKVKRLIADRTSKESMSKVITKDYDVVVDNMLMNGQEAIDAVSLFKDRIGHFVMTSTLSVYDPKPDALVETDFDAKMYTLKAPLNAPGNYQEGKRTAEHEIIKAPFSVSRLRIPIIVGPDDYTKRLLLHVTSSKEGKPIYFPNKDAVFSYLHAKDAARALAWLCKSKLNDVFNVSAPDAWTIEKLMNEIAFVTGKKFPYGTKEDPLSPFAISENYFLNTEKARLQGFEVAPLSTWLPGLITELNLEELKR